MFKDSIYVASAYKPGDKPAYSCHILIDPTTQDGSENLSMIMNTVEKVKVEAWGTAAAQANPEMFIADGNNKYAAKPESYADYQNKWFCALRNYSRPMLLGQDTSPIMPEEKKFYAGCFVGVQIDVWAKKDDMTRVNGKVMVLQFQADGPAIFDSQPDLSQFKQIVADIARAAFIQSGGGLQQPPMAPPPVAPGLQPLPQTAPIAPPVAPTQPPPRTPVWDAQTGQWVTPPY